MSIESARTSGRQHHRKNGSAEEARSKELEGDEELSERGSYAHGPRGEKSVTAKTLADPDPEGAHLRNPARPWCAYGRRSPS
jgi:hypothetical protein